MSQDRPVTVCVFGTLHTLRRERGLPTVVAVRVPSDGVTARDLAVQLDLPLDVIDGLFCNHVKAGLGRIVRPGDRVAFVPTGSPVSHPAFMGPFDED